MYLVHMPMHAMQQLLPETLFCRIHKSYIISLNRITGIAETSINIGESKIIPFGNVFKEEAVRKIRFSLGTELITQ